MKGFQLTVKDKENKVVIKKKIAAISMVAALKQAMKTYGNIYQEITVVPYEMI
jgi:hypothetical protein